MADSGDLGKLPPEIRKKIYSYLLVEPKTVGILRQLVGKKAKVARMGHHRNKKHRRQIYDRDARKWKKAPPCITSLLLVNKLTSQEAAQVLYGLNKFEFLHAAALDCFLTNIGPSRQYVRDIALMDQGILYKSGWAAMDRSLALLTQAPSLRSLEISHLAFCGYYVGGFREKQWKVTPEELVQHCKPLLESLSAAFQHQNLNLSMFDVIKIALPRCALDTDDEDFHKERHTNFWGDKSPTIRRIRTTHIPKVKAGGITWCNCVCDMAEETNRGFVQEVKDEIVKQLGLSVEDEENEEAN